MEVKTTCYEIAGIGITIEGNGEYAEAFRDYFKSEEKSILDENPLLRICIENSPDEIMIPAKYYSLSATIAFNDSDYYVKKKDFVYSVSNLFDKEKQVVLKLCYTRKNSMKNRALTFMRPNNVGVCKKQNKFVDSIMNYEVFLYIFAVLLMRRGKIFVHCGIVEHLNKAIVLAGTGGCGKTSTLFSFLQNKDFKYIAEDFGILGDDGNVYYMQKKMAVYQSDAKYKNPDVMKALKKLPFRHRMHWGLFRLMKMNPRYRFIPQQLFGEDRVAKKGKTDIIVYMSRIPQNASVSKQDIKIEELCTKIRNASFRELRELIEILYNIRAVGDENTRKAYPAVSELEKEYDEVLKQVLSNKVTGVLEVPLKVNPDDIAEILYQMYE